MEHHHMHNPVSALHWGYSGAPPHNTWVPPPTTTPTIITSSSNARGLKRSISDSECDDDYSESSSKDQTSPKTNDTDSCQHLSRKKRRGVIEKKRRDRINSSLSELKRLVPSAYEKQGSAKLEKAEILQLTVDHLKTLHSKGIDSLSYDPQRFAMDYHVVGFRECASEVARYLVNIEGMDIQDPLRMRLMSHLQCFVAQRELSVKNTAGTTGTTIGIGSGASPNWTHSSYQTNYSTNYTHPHSHHQNHHHHHHHQQQQQQQQHHQHQQQQQQQQHQQHQSHSHQSYLTAASSVSPSSNGSGYIPNLSQSIQTTTTSSITPTASIHEHQHSSTQQHTGGGGGVGAGGTSHNTNASQKPETSTTSSLLNEYNQHNQSQAQQQQQQQQQQQHHQQQQQQQQHQHQQHYNNTQQHETTHQDQHTGQTYTDLSSNIQRNTSAASIGYGNPQYPPGSAQIYGTGGGGSTNGGSGGYNTNGAKPYRPWGAEMAY